MQRASALLLLVCLATAVHSQIVIAPTSIHFGDIQIIKSVTRTVYVMNVGDEPVTMSGVGGGLYEPFAVEQNCQGTVLAPGHSCNMLISFTPDEAGEVFQASEGTWNDVPFRISITGNAVEAKLSIAPTEIDFGTVELGTSTERIVYVTNVGSAPAIMDGIGGGFDGGFWSSQNCQANTVNPGESCEMTIHFVPTTAGPVNTSTSGTWNSQKYTINVSANATAAEIIA